LASNKIDEDTFISNFLQNQYLVDVRKEGISNENESEKCVDKEGESWEQIFIDKTDDSTIKTI
jgi:hypothetical protein